jgi:hypothetical protein
MMSKRFVPDPTRRRGPLKGINHPVELEMLDMPDAKVQSKDRLKVQKKRAKAVVKLAKLRGA